MPAERRAAIIEATMHRLRPILLTDFGVPAGAVRGLVSRAAASAGAFPAESPTREIGRYVMR